MCQKLAGIALARQRLHLLGDLDDATQHVARLLELACDEERFTECEACIECKVGDASTTRNFVGGLEVLDGFVELLCATCHHPMEELVPRKDPWGNDALSVFCLAARDLEGLVGMLKGCVRVAFLQLDRREVVQHFALLHHRTHRLVHLERISGTVLGTEHVLAAHVEAGAIEQQPRGELTIILLCGPRRDIAVDAVGLIDITSCRESLEQAGVDALAHGDWPLHFVIVADQVVGHAPRIGCVVGEAHGPHGHRTVWDTSVSVHLRSLGDKAVAPRHEHLLHKACDTLGDLGRRLVGVALKDALSPRTTGELVEPCLELFGVLNLFKEAVHRIE